MCLAPRKNPTLFNILCNEKDPLEQREQKGVYKIPVMNMQTNEGSAYIGVITRTIAKCLEEHKRDTEQAKLTTLLAMDAYNKNVNINWKDAKQIKSVLNHTQPVVTELLEILKRLGKERLINKRVAWEPPQLGNMH